MTFREWWKKYGPEYAAPTPRRTLAKAIWDQLEKWHCETIDELGLAQKEVLRLMQENEELKNERKRRSTKDIQRYGPHHEWVSL